jgi:hypothetical protein
VNFPSDPGGSRTRDLRIKSCSPRKSASSAKSNHIVESAEPCSRMVPENPGAECKPLSNSRHPQRKAPDFSRRALPPGGQPGMPTNCELGTEPYVTKLHTVRLCQTHLDRVHEIASYAKGWSGRKPDVQPVNLMRASA